MKITEIKKVWEEEFELPDFVVGDLITEVVRLRAALEEIRLTSMGTNCCACEINFDTARKALGIS